MRDTWRLKLQYGILKGIVDDYATYKSKIEFIPDYIFDEPLGEIFTLICECHESGDKITRTTIGAYFKGEKSVAAEAWEGVIRYSRHLSSREFDLAVEQLKAAAGKKAFKSKPLSFNIPMPIQFIKAKTPQFAPTMGRPLDDLVKIEPIKIEETVPESASNAEWLKDFLDSPDEEIMELAELDERKITLEDIRIARGLPAKAEEVGEITTVATPGNLKKYMSRSQFVREHIQLPPEKIVSEGAKHGIEIKAFDIHNGRTWARKNNIDIPFVKRGSITVKQQLLTPTAAEQERAEYIKDREAWVHARLHLSNDEIRDLILAFGENTNSGSIALARYRFEKQTKEIVATREATQVVKELRKEVTSPYLQGENEINFVNMILLVGTERAKFLIERVEKGLGNIAELV